MRPTNLNHNDRTVLNALNGSDRPLSAYDILEKARSGAIKAPTQVYRSLQKLEDQGLVHRIEALSAFVACSDCHPSDQRPGFVICRDCGTVREFEDSRIAEIARTAAGAGFAINLVSLEIYGRCATCQPEPAGC